MDHARHRDATLLDTHTSARGRLTGSALDGPYRSAKAMQDKPKPRQCHVIWAMLEHGDDGLRRSQGILASSPLKRLARCDPGAELRLTGSRNFLSVRRATAKLDRARSRIERARRGGSGKTHLVRVIALQFLCTRPGKAKWFKHELPTLREASPELPTRMDVRVRRSRLARRAARGNSPVLRVRKSAQADACAWLPDFLPVEQ